jgi:hypothetical protein
MYPLQTLVDHTGTKQHDHHRPEVDRLQPGEIEYPPSYTQPEDADGNQQNAYFQFSGWIPTMMVRETTTHMAKIPILFLTDGHDSPPLAFFDSIIFHVSR